MATRRQRQKNTAPDPRYEPEERQPAGKSSPIVTEPPDERTGFVKPPSEPLVSEIPRHLSFGSNFPTMVFQLRSLCVIAIVLQMCVLYMESDRMGLALAVPLAVHLLNFYHTGKRLYLNIDGRFDLQQMLNVRNITLKGRYAFAVFGGLFFSILSHFVVGEIPSTMGALFYMVSQFTMIGSSGLEVAAEVFEAIMNKLGQSSTLPSKQL